SQPVRPGPCAAKPPARVGPSFRRRRRGEGPHSLTGMAFDDAVKQKVKDAFKSWDSNGDGIISKNEMKAVLLKLLNKHTSTVTEAPVSAAMGGGSHPVPRAPPAPHVPRPIAHLLSLSLFFPLPFILSNWACWAQQGRFTERSASMLYASRVRSAVDGLKSSPRDQGIMLVRALNEALLHGVAVRHAARHVAAQLLRNVVPQVFPLGHFRIGASFP
ncbi:unnamed protein product, partial [Prorocentrum cordatum]